MRIPCRYRPKDVARSLFTGQMEKSSLGYSTAKLTGIVLSSTVKEQLGLNWVSVIATNLNGKKVLTESYNAHVIPSLMKKFQDAKNNRISTVELPRHGTP